MSKKLTKLLSLLLAFTMLFSSIPMVSAGEEDEPLVVVSHESGKPGDTIELEVKLNNSPGVSNYGIVITYDDTKLTYNSSKVGDVIVENFGDKNATDLSANQKRFRANTSDGEAVENNGVLFVVYFDIAEDADSGIINGDDLKFDYFHSTFDGFTRISEVFNFTVSQGSITVLERETAQAPVISAQPVDASLPEGSSTHLSVTATSPDDGTLSYQWYKNTSAITSGGTEVAGANARTYAVPTGTVGTFYYYVVVTNTIADNGDGGKKTATAISDVATIIINAKVYAQLPAISVSPKSASVIVDSSHTLSVTAASQDDGTLSYQWYRNTSETNTGGTPVGENQATFDVSTGTAGTFYYYVVVTNTIADNGDGGVKTATTTSPVATIVISDKINAMQPTITTEPASASVIAKSAHSIEVSATSPDGGTLSYQWYSHTSASNSSGQPIENETKSNYKIPTDSVGTFYYYVVVTNTIADNDDGGVKTASTTSAVATMVVYVVNAVEPVVVTQPQGAKVEKDSNYNLSVVSSASDGGTLSYQWYSNTIDSLTGGQPLSGQTSSSFTVPTSTAGSLYYYVEIANTITDNGDGGEKVATNHSNIVMVEVYIPTYQFTVTASVGGTLQGTANGEYEAGTSISVTAKPDKGYLFDGWDTSSSVLSDAMDNPAEFYMPKAGVTLKANFIEDPSTVTGVSVSPASIQVMLGTTQLFGATVLGTNGPSQAVEWTVEDATSTDTVIGESGLLTVGTDETATELVVRATSLQDDAFDATATVTVTTTTPDPVYAIALNTSGEHVFPSVIEGYTSIGSFTVTITNTGNQATGILSFDPLNTDPAFELSKNDIDSISVGGSATFTVSPVMDLLEGSYADTISLGNANIAAISFDVAITINPIPTYYLAVNAGSNGSVSGTDSGNYVEGAPISVTATADTGYVFSGWTVSGVSLAGGNTANPATLNMPADAVTLTANFIPEVFTIIFELDGGTRSGGGAVQQVVQFGNSATAPIAIREGYTFLDWDTDFTNVASSFTVKALWVKNPVVTFDANGGNVTPATMFTGSDGKLVSLPTPSRSGYTFDGWFTEASGGTRITTDTVFAVDNTVYAQWTQTTSGYISPTPNTGSGSSTSDSTAPTNRSTTATVGGVDIRITAQNDGQTAVLNIGTSQANQMARSPEETLAFSVTGHEKATQVQIGKSALQILAKAGKNVVLETAHGSIQLSAGALLDICAQPGANVVVEILPLTADNLPANLSAAQKAVAVELLADGYQLFELNISSSSNNVSTFEGNIYFVLSYSGSNPGVVHIGDDGALTAVDSIFADGQLSIALPHFSLYAVGEKAAEETKPGEENKPDTQKPAEEDDDTTTPGDDDVTPSVSPIILSIDSTVVTQGDVVLDAPAVAPQIMGGRTMLPFRYLIQTILGGTVHWDDVTRTITAEVNGISFQMTIGDNTIIVGGESISFDQAPVIVDDYTLVPLRVFEKAVQYIGWDEATRTVTIYP